MIIKLFIQEIMKEEQPENGKNDKQFDDDDQPKIFSDGHISEPFVIKKENTPDYIHNDQN